MDLFSLSVVNAYGSQVVQMLKDDESHCPTSDQ